MAIASSLLQKEKRFADDPGREGFEEVIDGQIVEKPPMGVFEVWIASRLVRDLGQFASAHRLGHVVGEMLFVTDAERDRRRRPDVAFVSHARWPLERRIPRTAAWEVVPDLAIEVVSPTDLSDDVMTRMEEFFQAGTRRVWIIHPGQAKLYDYESPTLVRILTASDTLDGADILPGFRLPLAELFAADEGTTGT